MGNNILLNAFGVTKKTLVITDASGDGFGHTLMQKRNEDEVEARAQTRNNEKEIDGQRAPGTLRGPQDAKEYQGQILLAWDGGKCEEVGGGV